MTIFLILLGTFFLAYVISSVHSAYQKFLEVKKAQKMFLEALELPLYKVIVTMKGGEIFTKSFPPVAGLEKDESGRHKAIVLTSKEVSERYVEFLKETPVAVLDEGFINTKDILESKVESATL